MIIIIIRIIMVISIMIIIAAIITTIIIIISSSSFIICIPLASLVKILNLPGLAPRKAGSCCICQGNSTQFNVM